MTTPTFQAQIHEHIPRRGGTHYFQAVVYRIQWGTEPCYNGYQVETIWKSCLAYETKAEAEIDANCVAAMLNEGHLHQRGTQLRF